MVVKIFKSLEKARKHAASSRAKPGHYADIRHKDGEFRVYSGAFKRGKTKATKKRSKKRDYV